MWDYPHSIRFLVKTHLRWIQKLAWEASFCPQIRTPFELVSSAARALVLPTLQHPALPQHLPAKWAFNPGDGSGSGIGSGDVLGMVVDVGNCEMKVGVLSETYCMR